MRQDSASRCPSCQRRTPAKGEAGPERRWQGNGHNGHGFSQAARRARPAHSVPPRVPRLFPDCPSRHSTDTCGTRPRALHEGKYVIGVEHRIEVDCVIARKPRRKRGFSGAVRSGDHSEAVDHRGGSSSTSSSCPSAHLRTTLFPTRIVMGRPASKVRRTASALHSRAAFASFLSTTSLRRAASTTRATSSARSSASATRRPRSIAAPTSRDEVIQVQRRRRRLRNSTVIGGPWWSWRAMWPFAGKNSGRGSSTEVVRTPLTHTVILRPSTFTRMSFHCSVR